MFDYHSQFGADKYLNEKYYWSIDIPGIYVDIGAHDGITGSNTFFFEKQGWKGICFEPMPKAFKMLSQNRTCLKSQKAIANFKGEADFLAIEGYSEQLSGLMGNYSPDHVDRIHREVSEMNQTFQTIKVECSLFDEEVPFWPRAIDILSLDTEGSESSILRSIDFKKWNIKFMIVEFNHTDSSLVSYLYNQGYDPEIRLGVDIIFKKRDI